MGRPNVTVANQPKVNATGQQAWQTPNIERYSRRGENPENLSPRTLYNRDNPATPSDFDTVSVQSGKLVPAVTTTTLLQKHHQGGPFVLDHQGRTAVSMDVIRRNRQQRAKDLEEAKRLHKIHEEAAMKSRP